MADFIATRKELAWEADFSAAQAIVDEGLPWPSVAWNQEEDHGCWLVRTPGEDPLICDSVAEAAEYMSKWLAARARRARIGR
jgi:hypothetical protein